MANYIEVPELAITEAETEMLLRYFHETKNQYGKMYVTESGRQQDLLVVANFPKTELIEKICDKIDPFYIKNLYFLANHGIDIHVDDGRTCVISFELQNSERVPTDIYDSTITRNRIEQIHYKDLPIMWNTKAVHGAEESISQRIFFQIEIDTIFPFDDMVTIYKNGGLLV